jgi:uncharacterized protein YkwD
MPLTPRTLVALAAAVAALVVPAAASAASTLSAPETALLKEINRVRAAHGLGTLAYDPALTRAARAHTQAMTSANVFTHGAFRTRMVQFRVAGPQVGENLAWGSGAFGSPRGIVGAWLRSPEHRANLLRPGFRRIGLGEANATFLGVHAANVVTADFAGR